MSFEDTVDPDSLTLIISYVVTYHRIPFLFVNKRWRDVARRIKYEYPNRRNFQWITLCKSKHSGRRFRRLEIFWYTYNAASVSLDLLKWCVDMGCPWHKETASQIASTGNLETLQWAISRNCPWHADVIYIAASEGHLNIVKWAIEEWKSYDFDEAKRNHYSNPCVQAATNGRMETLMWLYDRGFMKNCGNPFRYGTIKKGKNLEAFEWLIQKGIEIQRCFVYFEDLETANWVVQNRSKFPDATFCARFLSRKEEYEDYISFVHEHGFHSSMILQTAAERGNMDVFLIAERVGLINLSQENTYSRGFLTSSLTSNIDLYKWLRERSPPQTKNLIIRGWNFSIEELSWALENGAELCGLVSLMGFVNSQNWEAAKLALKNGIKWGKRVHFESPESLRFAINNGFRLCNAYFLSQLNHYHHQVLDYAHSVGCPWNKKKSFQLMIKNLMYQNVKWIEGHSTIEERGGLSLKDFLIDS
eukprot:TRINITY_DN6350_c0_g2_i2.p1 TRINITY_DN6350_c0_g2~~TRINITY_DN6350_c0_g2_i2.p1  ORF type:complete len:474 (+),score=85.69 TRINITY_DN6350_c0_g2_i2:366-1787(+)